MTKSKRLPPNCKFVNCNTSAPLQRFNSPDTLCAFEARFAPTKDQSSLFLFKFLGHKAYVHSLSHLSRAHSLVYERKEPSTARQRTSQPLGSANNHSCLKQIIDPSDEHNKINTFIRSFFHAQNDPTNRSITQFCIVSSPYNEQTSNEFNHPNQRSCCYRHERIDE